MQCDPWLCLWNGKLCVSGLWAKPLVQPRIAHTGPGCGVPLRLFITWLQTVVFSSRCACEWMRLLWAGQALLPVCRCWLLFILVWLSFPVWAGWLLPACSQILVMSSFLLTSGICFWKSRAILEQDQSTGIIFSFSYCSEHHTLIFVSGILVATLLYWHGLKQIWVWIKARGTVLIVKEYAVRWTAE